jgi:hypothetical protein
MDRRTSCKAAMKQQGIMDTQAGCEADKRQHGDKDKTPSIREVVMP